MSSLIDTMYFRIAALLNPSMSVLQAVDSLWFFTLYEAIQKSLSAFIIFLPDCGVELASFALY